MIKYETIRVNISYRNITHYIKLGYNPILNTDLEIKTEHLSKSSHVKIDVICAICGTENILMFYKYIDNVKRQGFYGCKKCSRQKAALTSIEKYGVDNYSKTEEFKKRVEETNIEKFGYKTNLISPEFREKINNTLLDKYGTINFWELRGVKNRSKNKLILNENINNIEKIVISYSEDLYDDSLLTETYLLYRNECRRITKSNIKKLFKNWNGIDFYTNEDISNNFVLDHNDKDYPTIDHKTSVYFGFSNNISTKEIGSLDNLCITKRCINSSKRDLNNCEFLEKLNDIKIWMFL